MHRIREGFGSLVEAGAVIPGGHLEIIVMSLVPAEISITSHVCQMLMFVEIIEIVQMPRRIGMHMVSVYL